MNGENMGQEPFVNYQERMLKSIKDLVKSAQDMVSDSVLFILFIFNRDLDSRNEMTTLICKNPLLIGHRSSTLSPGATI